MGGWLLQASEGVTGRMNSVTCFGVVPPDVHTAIAAVEDWYRRRGLHPAFRLTEVDAALDRMLGGFGYGPRERSVVVMTKLLHGSIEAPSAVVAADLDEWCEAFRLCSEDSAARIGELCDAFRRVTDPRVLLVCHGDGEPVAVGAVVITGRFAGIFDLATRTGHRRRGHGRDLTVGLLAAAAGRGAQLCYLQVSEDNRAARSLYRGLGFAPGYRYWYRTVTAASGEGGP